MPNLSRKQCKRVPALLDRATQLVRSAAAWSVKERLRILLKERELSKIRGRPVDYDDALDAACPRPLGWPRPSRSDDRQSWSTSP